MIPRRNRRTRPKPPRRLSPASVNTACGRLEATRAADGLHLRLIGDWTLPHYRALAEQIEQTASADRPVAVDLDGVTHFDSAGAALLVDLLGAERAESLAAASTALPEARARLLEAVAKAGSKTATPPPASTPWRPLHWVDQIGIDVEHAVGEIARAVGFMGQVVTRLVTGGLRPRSWRLTAVAYQLEQSGLQAVPIVALLTFAVGAVMALLGATVLEQFGGAIYTVDLVTYAFLREFGVVLAAILLAGRSASAFAAQIGSMKANEELDALRAQGLDPLDLLVVPRVLAMMIALPLLTILAIFCGLAGGGVIAMVVVELPASRITALIGEVSVTHFLVGLSKAPLFAFVIAIIGCLEGLKSGSNAQSVGAHTTSAVVQSIFWVILLDAAVALFYTELGW